jgi:hypothetical protein
MPEANRLILALDKAECELSSSTSLDGLQEPDSFSLLLSLICLPVACALAVEPSEAEDGASAKAFLDSQGVFKLAKFLGNTLGTDGDGVLFSAAPVQLTWELAVMFLLDLVNNIPSLWQPWLSQLSDAGTDMLGIYQTG